MNGKRILVVDDEPELVRALGMRLSGRGYDVVAAYDGVQAMARIQKEKPDLVILDIHLPAGNGFKICERIRSQPETWGLPVIAITADPRPEAEHRCRRFGCTAFFRKPYDSRLLMDAVEAALPGQPVG
jgi:two-component system, cell cycle response regulator DivK